MKPILEKLHQIYLKLPPGATEQQLTEFEEELGRRLPQALRALYRDHNGEPPGLLEYRLLPLHDVYQVSEGVWCFWEYRYEPAANGADYHFAEGNVRDDDLRIFLSVQEFLQDMLNSPLSTAQVELPRLPEAFAQADKLNCPERTAALLEALDQAPPECAPRLLKYLRDEDEAVVIATCNWVARMNATEAIDTLASVVGDKAGLAARRALERLGAQIMDYEVPASVPLEFQEVVPKWLGGESQGYTLTLLKRDSNSPWEMKSCSSPNTSEPRIVQSARERPGLYFGSLDGHGSHQVAVEIIANAVDQFLQGQASHLRVRHDEWTLEVEDDGQGFPLDSELGGNYLTHYSNSPTADHHAPHVHLVTRGVGLAPVTAVCSEFQIESVRHGQGYRARYSRGELVGREQTDLDLTKGTRVRLTLDPDLWQVGFQAGPLRRRLFDFVHLIPGLTITLNQERFHAPRGLLDLAEFDTAQTSEKHLNYYGQSDYLILQVAASGETSRRVQIDSWVNGARTEEHGSHVDGALEALQEVGWRPARVMVHVIMNEPQYAGPVCRRLAVPKAMRQVRALMRKELLQGQVPIPAEQN